MKKIVSLLAVVALLAVFAVAAFAAGEPALVMNDYEAAPGDLVTFEVTIENNPGFSVGEMVVSFDTDALEFAPVNPDVAEDKWEYAEFATGFMGALNPQTGFVTFAAMSDLYDENALVVKFILKVKEGTLPGEYPVTISVDYIENLDGIVMEAVEFSGKVIVACNDHVAGEPVIENVVEASCTAEGSHDEVVYCTLCGCEMSRETVVDAKLAHTEGETVIENEVAATCGAAGSYDEVVYCSVCGEEMSRQTIATEKLDHTAGEAVIENEVAGTCQAKGSYDEVVYCSACGEELSRTTIETEMGEHVPAEAVKENVENADCVTPGSYDLVVYCSVCGEKLSSEHVEGELGDHVAGEVVIENEVAGADCQTKGSYDEVVYCTICDCELSRETKEGTVGEHGEIVFVDKADGKTHDCVCKICNEVLNNEEHTYGEFIDDPENEGWKYKVCDKCGYVHREGATPPPTGDNSLIAVAAATLAMLGIAVVVSKKKEF